MASLRRIRRNKCTGKVRHATKEAAYAARRKVKSVPSSCITVYKCEFCKGFHIGHNSSVKYLDNFNL